jgi:predicted amidohydrolase YtcJ
VSSGCAATSLQAIHVAEAFTNHLDELGTLGPGAPADLAVLDRDPFTGDPAEIGAARVVRTYVDGFDVFDAM